MPSNPRCCTSSSSSTEQSKAGNEGMGAGGVVGVSGGNKQGEICGRFPARGRGLELDELSWPKPSWDSVELKMWLST